MSQIIKSFLGVFLLLVMCSVGITIFAMFLHVMSAQNLHADIVNELENSAFHKSVIENCFERAEDESCKLKLTLYDDQNISTVITKKEDIPQELGAIVSARVDMIFELNLPFVPTKESHIFSAYAF